MKWQRRLILPPMMLISQLLADALKVANYAPVAHSQVREHGPTFKRVDEVEQHARVIGVEEKGEEDTGDDEALHCHQ